MRVAGVVGHAGLHADAAPSVPTHVWGMQSALLPLAARPSLPACFAAVSVSVGAAIGTSPIVPAAVSVALSFGAASLHELCGRHGPVCVHQRRLM